MMSYKCALCGATDRDVEALNFVTVDTLGDADDLSGGVIERHVLYVCAECRGKESRSFGVLGYLVATLWGWGSMLFTCYLAQFFSFKVGCFSVVWIVVVNIPGVVGVLLFRRRFQSQLKRIAASRHDAIGHVRVYTWEEFEDLQYKRKRAKSKQLTAVDYDDDVMPVDDDEPQWQDESEESQSDAR